MLAVEFRDYVITVFWGRIQLRTCLALGFKRRCWIKYLVKACIDCGKTLPWDPVFLKFSKSLPTLGLKRQNFAAVVQNYIAEALPYLEGS